MTIAVDTNVWVRYLTWDHEAQARTAGEVIEGADAIAVPTIILCELAWVLKRAYRYATGEIVDAISDIARADTVSVDRPAVAAGLDALRAGADFADGVIRFEAERARCQRMYTFDQGFAQASDPAKVILLGAA